MNPISSDCVISQVPAIPGFDMCNSTSITDLLYKLTTLVSSLAGSEATDYSSLLSALNAALDLSGVNLGCLYQSTVQTWSCPVGQTFVPDSSALLVNGTAGFCQIGSGSTSEITLNVPVASTTLNPVPPPTTLSGILNLMISKIPCCDPCNQNKGG